MLFVTKGTFGQLTCEWQYTYDEFTKEPFIVEGRRLRIEAKVCELNVLFAFCLTVYRIELGILDLSPFNF